MIRAFLGLVLLALPAAAEAMPLDKIQKQEAGYANSEKGLRQLIEDLLALARAGKQDELRSRTKNFAIPNHEAWFARVFGPNAGRVLASLYAESVPEFESVIPEILTGAARWNRTEISVQHIRSAEEQTADSVLLAVLASMQQPPEIFRLQLIQKGGAGKADPGYFVFEEGHFRLLGRMAILMVDGVPRILLAKPSDKWQPPEPLTTRAPRYPPQAIQSRVTGVARILATIHENGTVTDVSILSAPPWLGEAARDAVSQWQYKPAEWNGQPVAVQVIIQVIFALRR